MLKFLHLTKIECVETEDWVGSDELGFSVEGDDFWRIGSMNNGDTKDLALRFPFEESITVRLIDEEIVKGDDDDVLGKKTVKSGSGVLEYTWDGAHYKVWYKVAAG